MKQKIVIKVEMHCDKCRTKAKKIAATASGVTSVALEGADKDQIVVVGEEVDSVKLARSLRKKVGHASLMSVQEEKDKEKEKGEGEGEGEGDGEMVMPTKSILLLFTASNV
ncbi:hypothetical protein OIU77_015654 [Salix suchowensis]|uniref:HMA domain-containing protein n=1 Tax=Salix suchowensis TaxID=1278906 RepID=A0ABQ8ZHY8_9ROSI|nr:hypothetical protein OIU77_015654 [Salix suchowensis]